MLDSCALQLAELFPVPAPFNQHQHMTLVAQDDVAQVLNSVIVSASFTRHVFLSVSCHLLPRCHLLLLVLNTFRVPINN